MRVLFFLLIFTFLTEVSCSQEIKTTVSISDPDSQYVLTGELGEKLGSVVTVCGVIVEGPGKGYEGGPNLLVQMINGRYYQRKIQVPVSSVFGDIEDFTPELKNGYTYRLKVYETGEFVGIPPEAYKQLKRLIQTTNFYFRNRLVIISAERIDPIEWSPEKFVGQMALLAGIAKNENDTATIQYSNWKLRLIGYRKWSDEENGKKAEVYGSIRETGITGTYDVINAEPRLANLKDQLGKTVRLRGRAWSMNGYWWFTYRGTEIYVENMDKLPNWKAENHGAAIEISGTLEQAMLPAIDQISLKQDRDLKMYFIVRKASWSPAEELLIPESDLE